MRYESSNNLNIVSDLDSERGKSKASKKDKKGMNFRTLTIILEGVDFRHFVWVIRRHAT